MFELTDTAGMVANLKHEESVAKAERRARLDWDTNPKQGTRRIHINLFDNVKTRLNAALRRPAPSLSTGS
jgi:hypothetical protein